MHKFEDILTRQFNACVDYLLENIEDIPNFSNLRNLIKKIKHANLPKYLDRRV